MDFIVHFDTGEPVTVKDATEAEVRDGILHIHGGPKAFPLVAAFKEWSHFGNTQEPATSELQNQRDDLLAALQALRTMVKYDPEYVRWVQNNRVLQKAERAIAKAKGETTE